MFIQVKLLNGFKKPLWYKIPASWGQQSLKETIIQVPLRNTIIPAVIVREQLKPYSQEKLHAGLFFLCYPWQ